MLIYPNSYYLCILKTMTEVKKTHKSLRTRGRGNIIAILLTVLFAAYYSGSTLFVHTHFTGFGHGLVTHSHPYLPDNHHSHSTNEFDAIACLTDFSTEEIEFADVPVEEETLLCIFLIEPVSTCATVDCRFASLRAPPVRFI